MRKTPADSQPADAADAKPRPKKRHSRWRTAAIVLAVIIALLGIGRLLMPGAVRWYVNRTLDQSLLYKGKIGPIQIHLWRGAYSIQDVRINKITGNVPVPLFSANRVEFTIQWNALLHHKVVGQVVMDQPQVNFVDSPSDADSQTGAGGPWLKMIQDLFPFDINSAKINDGSIHFRTFQTGGEVDVYLDKLNATVDNVTNIRNETTPMITTIKAHALAMDQADFDFEMRLNPFSYYPSYHLATRLIGLDVTKTNDLVRTYGKFDFKHGWFDLVLEINCREGLARGYVKPLFRDLVVFDLPQDIRHDDPLQFFWQALLGVTTQLLKNQPRDQFGTLIPFTVDLTSTKPDILVTIGNILQNAFIRAYLPKLQPGQVGGQTIEFGPPQSMSDSISIGDQP